MAGATGSSYGINAKTKNPDLATKFINFLTTRTPPTCTPRPTARCPPSRTTHSQVDPALASLAEYQKENKTDPFMDQFWPNARVQQTHFDVVQALLGDNTTVQDALAKMDAAYAQGA